MGEYEPFFTALILYWICFLIWNAFNNPLIKKIAAYGVMFFAGFLLSSVFF